MRVYFDGVLIDNNYLANFTKSGSVYNGVFKLGSTICETYKLTVDKTAYSGIPETVYIGGNYQEVIGNNEIEITNYKLTNPLQYKVEGAIEQNGTPTPSNPASIETIKGDSNGKLNIKITNGNEERIVQIDLMGNELCKLGDCKDTLSIDEYGNIFLEKNIDKIVLNGSENWIQSGTRFHINFADYENGTYRVISDYFEEATSWSQHTATNYSIVLYKDAGWSSARLSINDSDFVSGTPFKQWLSNNNVSVYCQLPETYPISLGNISEFLFEGTNHIELVDEIETTTSIKTEEIYKILYVSDYNDEDDFVIVLDLEDAMTKFNFKYDASPIMTHTKVVDDKTINYAYLSEILDDICDKAGIINGISSFYGDDIEASWYNNTYMARDYLSYIAEINACNLCIDGATNSLIFKGINITPVNTISIDNISKYRIGAEHTITRVVWDNGINKWEYGSDTGETYYINTDNVYVLDTETVEHIYNIIQGFTYYNFKTNNCPLTGLNTGDLIAFTDGTNTYKTFTQFDNAKFSNDDWFGGIELNLENEVKQETEVVGESDRVREIRQTVDRLNNQVEIVVRETGELETEVRTLQTSTYTKTEIQRIVDGTGVDGVKVSAVETMSGTFDIDGMHYAKSNAKTESTINQAGLEVITTEEDEELLFAGYDEDMGKAVVRTENLIARKFLVIGDNSRVQDYGNGGGVFIL